MGRIQRLIAPQARGGVNFSDPAAAKLPLIIGQTLQRSINKLEAISEERAGARRVSEATRLATQARISLDRWNAEQEPYDIEGNPRFEGIDEEFEVHFSDVLQTTMGLTKDQKVRNAVEKSLLAYKEGAVGDWLVTGQKWETAHGLGELNAAMLELETNALTNPDNSASASAQALALLEKNVQVGNISPTAATNKYTEFNVNVVKGTFRNTLDAGNYTAAGNIIELAKTLPGVSTDQVKSFKSEYTAAFNAALSAEAKAAKRRQDKVSLALLSSNRPVAERLQLLDDAANMNIISDPAEYRAVQSALQKEAAPVDDIPTVKSFMTIFATTGVTATDLASVKDKVTAETYTSFARMVKQSQDSPEIFEKPEVKQAIKHIEERLTQGGRIGRVFTEVERKYIPQAKVEMTFAAMDLARQGKLSYATAIDAAERIASKYELNIPAATGGKAPIPEFRTAEEIKEAYKAGKMGVIGTDEARIRLNIKLNETNNWNYANELRQRRAQQVGTAQSEAKEPQGEGLLPKGLGQ